MSDKRDAEYVKNEVLELLSAAVENGLSEYVGFLVEDGELRAETYDDAGNVEQSWQVDVSVRRADPSGGGE